MVFVWTVGERGHTANEDVHLQLRGGGGKRHNVNLSDLMVRSIETESESSSAPLSTQERVWPLMLYLYIYTMDGTPKCRLMFLQKEMWTKHRYLRLVDV